MWQLREWWLPKEGNSPEEYEDAFRTDPERGRFAVSDGATETSFAGRWAAALVAAFVAGPPAPDADIDAMVAWLAPMQQEWHASVPWDRLPWYAEEKARAGAFASLLGLEFSLGDQGGAAWRATAVGDSVFFHLREGVLLQAWPVAAAAQLGSRPLLLSSLSGSERVAQAGWTSTTGTALPGDRFLMTTDALAHWILARAEAGEPPWESLWACESAGAFSAFVDTERAAHRMRNDDVTLVAFSVPELAVGSRPLAVGGSQSRVGDRKPGARRRRRRRAGNR